MLDGAAHPLLQVRNLEAWYGESYVLHGMDFDVAEGEVITLLGRNGAGKSTTIKALMGMVPRVTGSARFRGEEIVGSASHRIARCGLAYCPEERGIFASLTVMENLMLPRLVADDPMPLSRVFELFPNLYERRTTSQGSKLSGGEQQMLAIARILRTGARFLLLDEPNEGLAPVILQQIQRVISELKASRYTILLVEQDFNFASTVADRHYVVEGGRVVDIIPNEHLKRDDTKLRAYLGV